MLWPTRFRVSGSSSEASAVEKVLTATELSQHLDLPSDDAVRTDELTKEKIRPLISNISFQLKPIAAVSDCPSKAKVLPK
mmetsp:Transcript_38344/g.79729  ORF Transcript_38344/g.79729 Transcript_38344/m.79729 type:complete len:80 (+) Transcript_38344:751-990(+)